jgi:serine/threonine protein kinase
MSAGINSTIEELNGFAKINYMLVKSRYNIDILNNNFTPLISFLFLDKEIIRDYCQEGVNKGLRNMYDNLNNVLPAMISEPNEITLGNYMTEIRGNLFNPRRTRNNTTRTERHKPNPTIRKKLERFSTRRNNFKNNLIEIMIQLINSQNYLGEFNMLHGDLKADNIMLKTRNYDGNRNGWVKIIDYGGLCYTNELLNGKNLGAGYSLGKLPRLHQLVEEAQINENIDELNSLFTRARTWELGILLFDLLGINYELGNLDEAREELRKRLTLLRLESDIVELFLSFSDEDTLPNLNLENENSVNIDDDNILLVLNNELDRNNVEIPNFMQGVRGGKKKKKRKKIKKRRKN